MAVMMNTLLATHVAAGSVALASMFVPMVARKGGTLHRRAGWVFVASMGLVAATAFILSGHRFLFDARPDARDFGIFLFFVSILTTASVSAGVRVLRFKNRTAPHVHWWDTGLPALLVLASIAMAAYGIGHALPLFIAFSAIGLVTGAGSLRYWLHRPKSRLHWWLEHMGTMLGGCIAATTAFLVNAGDAIGIVGMAAWLAPSVVGGTGIAIANVYYRRRMTSTYLDKSGASGPLYART